MQFFLKTSVVDSNAGAIRFSVTNSFCFRVFGEQPEMSSHQQSRSYYNGMNGIRYEGTEKTNWIKSTCFWLFVKFPETNRVSNRKANCSSIATGCFHKYGQRIFLKSISSFKKTIYKTIWLLKIDSLLMVRQMPWI